MLHFTSFRAQISMTVLTDDTFGHTTVCGGKAAFTANGSEQTYDQWFTL